MCWCISLHTPLQACVQRCLTKTEPCSRLLTFAWEGSLVAECSLNLVWITWPHGKPFFFCLMSCDASATESNISTNSFWLEFLFLSCFTSDALSFFFASSHISILLVSHPFFFFLVFSSYHHFFHFPFHPLSLPGGHLGRCDLWPAVSERVRVRERDREWKWGGGLEQGPTETSSRLQHPVPLPRPGPPPNVWGKHLQSCHVIISVMHFFMLTKSTSSNLVRSSTWKLSSMREGLRWVSMLEHSQICN